jgi:DNA polymerase elongation subunit (family B)
MTDKSLEFQIYDWMEDHYIEKTDEDSGSENQHKMGEYIIHIFGRTMEGKSVYGKVINFTPYFYIELPESWSSLSDSKLELKLGEFKKFLLSYNNKKIWQKFKSTLVDIKLITAKKAEGFTNDSLFKFARLTFNNSDGMKKFRMFFEENDIDYDFKKLKFKTYEANVPPMFRCFHNRNISGCAWVETSKYIQIKKDALKESYCDIELNVNWKDLNPIKKDFNAPLRIASFDIECYSHDGQFPQANRKQDTIIQIGITYTYLGQSEPYRQYIGCLDKTEPFDDKTVLKSFDEESDLLLDFKDEIINADCDIITGYNIFYFDEKYIYDRADQILGIKDEMAFMSKLKKRYCNFKEMKLASSALGENLLRFWDTPGRVHIDLMKDVQKTFSLPCYKLDYVASNFIRGEIKNYTEIKNYVFELECASVDDICLQDYIHLEVIKGFVSDEVGEKYVVTKIDKPNKKLYVQGDKYLDQDLKSAKETGGGKIFWSQAKDDVGPKEIFKFQKGSPKDRSIVAKYCIKDCKLVNLLINKLEVITKNIEMANVCCVPLSYLFIRGQGIKTFSLVVKEFKEQGYLFPVIKMQKVKLCKQCNIETKGYNCPKCKGKNLEDIETDESYEGAIVFDPVPMVDFEANVTKDYNSLYPSAGIQKNMSHEKKVTDDKYDNLPGVKYYNAQFVESDGTIQYRRFAQKNNELGVIPLIWDKLLKERKAVKKQMEAEKDQFKKKILDAKQLALKITANSLYGQLGASTSPICDKDIAACITNTGREMLILGKKYDEEILPWLLNGMKKALEKNDEEKFMNFIKMELKNNTGEYAEKFISDLKKYLIEDLSMKTFQPVVRYGDTDSNFSCYRIREDLSKVSKSDALGVWKEIIKFSKELIKPFIPDEFQNKWCQLHDKYYGEDKIKSLSLPEAPEVKPVATHWKTLLSTDDRLKQYLKEYMEESFFPWIWCLQEIVIKNHPNMDYKLNQWAQHQMNKIRFIANDFTDETVQGYNDRLKEINLRLRKIAIETKNDPILAESKKEEIDALNKETEEKQKIFNELSDKKSSIERNIKEFCTNVLQDYWIQPWWDLVDNKKVHNVEFYKEGKSITDKRSLELSMEIGKISGELIKSRLPFPHNFAYEKTFWPFLILCKKKYVGNKYEDNPNKYKQDFMGIVLKRRDNSPIVKEVCGGIIDILINKRDPIGAKAYLKKCLDDMFAGKYDIKYFLQSRTLKMKESYADWTRIAHVYLSEKIALRDPGNKPQSGDRIEFAVIKVKNDDPKKKLLQGELIETPAYIKQNNLEIDYLFYMTNQIQNPAVQFLQLVDDKIKDLFDEYKEKYGPKKIIKEKKVKEVKEKKPRVSKKIIKVEPSVPIEVINEKVKVKRTKKVKEPVIEEPVVEEPVVEEPVVEEPVVEEPVVEEPIIEEPVPKTKTKKSNKKSVEPVIIEAVVNSIPPIIEKKKKSLSKSKEKDKDLDI